MITAPDDSIRRSAISWSMAAARPHRVRRDVDADTRPPADRAPSAARRRASRCRTAARARRPPLATAAKISPHAPQLNAILRAHGACSRSVKQRRRSRPQLLRILFVTAVAHAQDPRPVDQPPAIPHDSLRPRQSPPAAAPACRPPTAPYLGPHQLGLRGNGAGRRFWRLWPCRQNTVAARVAHWP